MLAELVRLAELEAQSRGSVSQTIALVPSTAEEMCSAVEVFIRDADPVEVRKFMLFILGLIAKRTEPETEPEDELSAEPDSVGLTDDDTPTPAEPAPLTEEGEPT